MVLFAALACAFTWLLGFPLAWSWLSGVEPQPHAVALAGLSALGPSFAAFVVARREGRLGEVFGRYRAQPLWILLALALPFLLHLPAKIIVALFGQSVEWFWVPADAARFAAMFLFSVGEEFGWRGYAHPRLLARHGAVRGPLLTGALWWLWHLAYYVTPSGGFDTIGFALLLPETVLWSFVIAWLFERNARSLLIAMAVHAGAHLDNSSHIPAEHWQLRALTLLMLAIAALFAARALVARLREHPHGAQRPEAP